MDCKSRNHYIADGSYQYLVWSFNCFSQADLLDLSRHFIQRLVMSYFLLNLCKLRHAIGVIISLLTLISSLQCLADEPSGRSINSQVAKLIKDPGPGIASNYYLDRGIEDHPRVLAACGFTNSQWKKLFEVKKVTNTIFLATPKKKPAGFEPFRGRALTMMVKEGEHLGGSLKYNFAEHHGGKEPAFIFFRYYLYFDEDWDGRHGKLPGFGGTYGVAGWGGRPVNGTDGWSARGSFKGLPDGKVRLATYCYHAEMNKDYGYGDVWEWDIKQRGRIDKSRWYCIEQFLRLNSPGMNDGVMLAWVDAEVAFKKTDILFRKSKNLRIENVWLNVYHGGKSVAESDDHLYIDNIVIASSYIGPVNQTEVDF